MNEGPSRKARLEPFGWLIHPACLVETFERLLAKPSHHGNSRFLQFCIMSDILFGGMQRTTSTAGGIS
jgi:hypothetical protein